MKFGPTPVEGDIRMRVIFAFLPRRCDDNYTRWLERVLVKEMFSTCFNCDGSYLWWVETSVKGIKS